MKVGFSIILGSILFSCTLPAANSDPSIQFPEGEQAIETTVPPDLSYLQLENPFVTFLVDIDSNGQMTQSMAVKATHCDLLEKAEKKLSEAKFTPARKNGANVAAERFVTIYFYDPIQRAWKRGLGGLPMGNNVNEVAARRMYEISKGSYSFGESSPADLDAPLTLDKSELYLLEEADKSVKTGTVVVEYFIDHHGRVRFPRIIRSDHDSLAESVLLTLSKTLFLPPKANGNPTFVRVRQPFNFN